MPVVVYSSLVGTHDTFFVRPVGRQRWRMHPVAAAGRTLFTYHNSGITLDHDDPSWVVLSRTIDGQNEIEARHTPDHGSSWWRSAHPRITVVQHPAGDPARPERSAQARGALRLGLGHGLPRVRHGSRDGHRRARRFPPAAAASRLYSPHGRAGRRDGARGVCHRGDDRPGRHGRRVPRAQLELDRDVAIKVIAPERVEDGGRASASCSEARTAAAIEHPNVIPVYGAGEWTARRIWSCAT